MFQSRSEYDRGVNTFSPEGRLFQVEYAIEAIKIGTTAIGISTSEGIVLAVEKRLLSPLQEASSVEKLAEIDSHIGCAMSGLSADARTLIDHARSESQYHRFTFNEPMKVDSLTQAVCDLALRFGESGEENTMSRPFGVALLVAGWDKHGPALYHTDPSGTFTRFDAKAIGAGERDEGGDDDRADQKAVAKKIDASHSTRGSDGSDGTDEAAVARFAIHAPRGEKGAATAAAGGSSSADVETFAGQGRVFVDALKVAEALKESVRSELALKMTESKRLVFELLQPRSAARLFWACHPLVPDPLGVASRMKERGMGPKRPSRDAAAR